MYDLKKMVERLIDKPMHLEINRAIGCIVTKEEHSQLDVSYDGCKRYKRAKIQVWDRKDNTLISDAHERSKNKPSYTTYFVLALSLLRFSQGTAEISYQASACCVSGRHRQWPTGFHLRGASFAPDSLSLPLRDPFRSAGCGLCLLFPL